MNLYPNWLKADVVAWHGLKQQIMNHVQDAQNTMVEKETKKKNKR